MQTLRKLPSSRPATTAAASMSSNCAPALKIITPEYIGVNRPPIKMMCMDVTAQDAQLKREQTERLQQSFVRAAEIMHRLRAPGGCPWDREQTFESLRRYTIEEAYEVVDAVERSDWPALKDELGDLLLQVLFYAEMAEEADLFGLEDVIENLSAKLIRRHPHVFGGGTGVESSDQVVANWEEIKQRERAERAEPGRASLLDAVLDAVPRGMPALMEASKLGSKAGRAGFDWSEAAPVFDKLEEEIGELRRAVEAGSRGEQEEELGDVLFTVVNLARKLQLQAEFALRSSNAKFRRRFGAMELLAPNGGLEKMTPEELEVLWERAKQSERAKQTERLAE
jgi:ATP diphosphatase